MSVVIKALVRQPQRGERRAGLSRADVAAFVAAWYRSGTTRPLQDYLGWEPDGSDTIAEGRG